MPLFTTAEARAFVVGDRTPLSDATKYPDLAITAAEAGIRAAFLRITGVAFVPVTETVIVNGARAGYPLILPRPQVTAVGTVEQHDGTAWVTLDGASGAALEIDGYLLHWRGGSWPRPNRTVRLALTHGFTTVPYDIKRAALILAFRWLTSDTLGDRTLSTTTPDGGTERFAIAGGNGGRWYFGYPEVDSVLARYAEPLARVG